MKKRTNPQTELLGGAMLFVAIIAMILLMITGCKKEPITPGTGSPGTYASITLRPDGAHGTPYQYRVYCTYAPELIFRIDSSQDASFYIRGTVDTANPLITIPMTRNEFYYVIAWRTPEEYHVDSFYYHNANGDGMAYITSSIHWQSFNRTITASRALPATEF